METPAQRLNDLVPRAVAQWAAVRGEEPSPESKRRGAIVEKGIELQSRIAEGAPVSVAEIDAFQAELDATDQASYDAFVANERERYEKAKEQKQLDQEAAKAELSQSPEPNIVALLNSILEKKNIGLETWLRDHPDIKRSTFLDWKAAASGKLVKGKFSVAKAQEFEAAIRGDAMELGLIDCTR